MFNMPLGQGGLPTSWKRAVVTPMHKIGLRQLLLNYRAISLTSVIVKILERITKVAITTFVGSNNLLDSEQRGFGRVYSAKQISLQQWRNRQRL